MSRRVLLPLLFLASLPMFLAATLPLALVLDALAPPGFEAGRVRGTLWGGSVTPARLDGRQLDRVRLALRPAGLLTARWRLDIFADGPGLAAQGRIEKGLFGGPTRVSRVRSRLDLAHQGFSAPAPVLGVVDLALSEAQIASGGCLKAVGRIETDLLARSGERFDWAGPALAGPVRCEDGRFVADLSAPDQAAGIAARLSFSLDGSLRLALSLQRPSPQIATALSLYGFERDGNLLVLTLPKGAPA